MSASFGCRIWGSASLNYLRGPRRVSYAYNVRFTQRNGKSKAKCWIRTSCAISPSYFFTDCNCSSFLSSHGFNQNIYNIISLVTCFVFISWEVCSSELLLSPWEVIHSQINARLSRLKGKYNCIRYYKFQIHLFLKRNSKCMKLCVYRSAFGCCTRTGKGSLYQKLPRAVFIPLHYQP